MMRIIENLTLTQGYKEHGNKVKSELKKFNGDIESHWYADLG